MYPDYQELMSTNADRPSRFGRFIDALTLRFFWLAVGLFGGYLWFWGQGAGL